MLQNRGVVVFLSSLFSPISVTGVHSVLSLDSLVFPSVYKALISQANLSCLEADSWLETPSCIVSALSFYPRAFLAQLNLRPDSLNNSWFWDAESCTSDDCWVKPDFQHGFREVVLPISTFLTQDRRLSRINRRANGALSAVYVVCVLFTANGHTLGYSPRMNRL